MGMGMRDIQSPAGVWFPTGMDAVGVESWAIKVPAKVVKDEVKWQLGRWKAEYALAERGDSKLEVPILKLLSYEVTTPLGKWLDQQDIDKERKSLSLASLDKWQKWHTYLANMPDDEVLSMTKKDYETFFADRDQREGK